MAKKNLGSHAWEAGGQWSWKLSGLPDFEPGGISYLDAIWLDVNITDLDNAGGDTTSIDIYNAICQAITIDDGTEPWGPSNLLGEHLAESRYLASRRVIPFQGNANGDRTVTAGTNATRRFAIVYDYRAYGGELGDATPLCKAMKNGQVSVNFGDLPTNTTSLTCTITCYALTHGEPTVRAVPRILTSKMQLPGMTFDVTQSGIYLQAFLRNSGDFVAADITKVLADVNGVPLLGNIDPFGFDTLDSFGVANPLVSSSLVQNHFCEVIGGTEPRALEMLSFAPGQNWSARPMGTGLHVELTGAEDYANLQLITTYARFMDAAFAGRQFTAAGAPDSIVDALASGAADVAKAKTKNGRPLRDPKMAGYISMELTDEAALRRIGVSF